jgi:hypothetical protein
MMELYFTDISIDLINNDNYYPEFIDLNSLDNNLDDKYPNIEEELIDDDDSVNEFFY